MQRMIKKLFCWHEYMIFESHKYSIHVWSVESFPSNNVYRYEYSICQVVCKKCNATKANYHMYDVDHPFSHKETTRIIYQDIADIKRSLF